MYSKSFSPSRIGLRWKLFFALITISLVGLLVSTYLECKDTKLLIMELLERDLELPTKNSVRSVKDESSTMSEKLVEESFTEELVTAVTTAIRQKRVAIGAVSCRNATDTMKYNEETLVMIKSVLISAKLYKIAKIELYLFLEHKEDEKYFSVKLEEMGYSNHSTELNIFMLSAVDIVPEKYSEHMIYHPRYRCGYTRFFFPSALPQVDSIIHIDSDMIVTGNLWKIWEIFEEFQGEQMIGAARSNEPHDTQYLQMYQKWFGDIPHPLPRGINAGLLLMNLTKMREYGWEQRFLRTFRDYSKLVNLTGQRTVSVVLGNDPGILKMLSCQYNFCHRHCDSGFTCFDAVQEGDKGGIHLVHGNGFQMEKGGVFEEIFKSYQEFNMNTIINGGEVDEHEGFVKNVVDLLMLPIRTFYSKPHFSKCHGTLNHVLFRDFFNDTTVYSLGAK